MRRRNLRGERMDSGRCQQGKKGMQGKETVGVLPLRCGDRYETPYNGADFNARKYTSSV